MKKALLAALLIMSSQAANAVIHSTDATMKNTTTNAHLYFTDKLNHPQEGPFYAPGVPDPYAWLAREVSDFFPKIAQEWKVRGFNPVLNPRLLHCESRHRNYQSEEHENLWRYVNDRTYSCVWGGSVFDIVIQVVFERTATQTHWVRTEATESFHF